MSDGRGSRRHVAIPILPLIVVLIVAACGGATASVAPSATPAPAPTTAPTPSPTPVDVSAAFVKIATSPDFSAIGKIVGKLTIGTVDGEISGDGAFDGADSKGTTTLVAGTFRQVTHSVTVGNQSWAQTEPGPWLLDTRASAKQGLDDYLRSVTAVVDVGVVTYAGRQLHHLQPKAGNEVSPDQLGFDVGTATDAAFTADLYATDDGTPAILAVTGSWTQASGATSVKTTVTFDLVFSDAGKPQTIEPPEDVWVRYTSKTLGYSMAHPADWTVKPSKDEDAYLLEGQPYVHVVVEPFKGSTAQYGTAVKAAYKRDVSAAPTETATRLGGQPAIRLVYQYTNSNAQDVTIAHDVTSRNGTGWSVFMVTPGGLEDIDVFVEFVAAFEFTR